MISFRRVWHRVAHLAWSRIILRVWGGLISSLQSAITWAVIYLLIIPVWAYIYYNIPDGFYDQSIKLEPSTNQDNRNAANKFCEYLKQQISGETLYPIKIGNEEAVLLFSPDTLTCARQFQINSDLILHTQIVSGFDIYPKNKFIYEDVIRISGLILSDVAIQPEIRTFFDDKTQLPTDEYVTPPNFDIKSTISSLFFKHGDQPEDIKHEQDPLGSTLAELKILQTPRVDLSVSIIPILNKFKQYYESILQYGDSATVIDSLGGLFDETADKDAPVVVNPISSKIIDVNSYVEKLEHEQDGDTSDASENFLRMLYFSATTVTTLGFGDIVPVTGIARLFVGFEAVFGIISIGMFLNGLANKIKR